MQRAVLIHLILGTLTRLTTRLRRTLSTILYLIELITSTTYQRIRVGSVTPFS